MEIMSKQNGQKVQLTKTSASQEDADSRRNQIVALVRRWGGSASAAVLDPTTQIFTTPEVEGLIGYRLESSCAIAFGDPVCSQDNIPRLVQAFHSFCEKLDYNIIYITTTERFARWAISNVCKTLIESGEELTYNPHFDPRDHEGVRGSLVRRKVRHALHEGVSVEEYMPHDPKLESAIEEVGDIWLKSRHGPQVYISHHHLFTDRPGKRWFYAKHNNQIVGVAQLNQLQAHAGWLLNHVMHTPDAPHGTPELLVVTALETIRKEGCQYVTFGNVPTEKLGEILGQGSVAQVFTRLTFKVITKIFRLSGRKKFWEKFEPVSSRSYLVFSKPRIGLREIRGLMRALNVSFN